MILILKKLPRKETNKIFASKKECWDKILAMEKVSKLKHKRKIEFLGKKIKNKKLKI